MLLSLRRWWWRPRACGPGRAGGIAGDSVGISAWCDVCRGGGGPPDGSPKGPSLSQPGLPPRSGCSVGSKRTNRGSNMPARDMAREAFFGRSHARRNGPLWGLSVRNLAPLCLYYGGSGKPSTFDPAGHHWKPAHLRAETCTFEGKIYGSEPGRFAQGDAGPSGTGHRHFATDWSASSAAGPAP